MGRIRTDPRPAQSRARLLEAATALLNAGGPNAVTVGAVTRASHVARATLYRQFGSGNDLLAAAFHALIPTAPMTPGYGTLRERLVGIVSAQAELIAEAPGCLAAMSWLALSGNLDQLSSSKERRRSVGPEIRTLRERIIEQYGAPLDAIFDSPDAIAELGDIDRTNATALLMGPIVLGKFQMLTEFDYREVAQAAVDGFLATHAKSPLAHAPPS